MIFKIIFDENENPTQAELWMELSNMPPSELDANPNGYRFNGVGWVDANSKEEALEKAKHLNYQ